MQRKNVDKRSATELCFRETRAEQKHESIAGTRLLQIQFSSGQSSPWTDWRIMRDVNKETNDKKKDSIITNKTDIQ